MSNENLSDYVAQIDAWRAQREADLRAPDGWLSLAGLFILREGHHTIGSSASNDIILPASAPAYLGAIEFRHNQASLTVTTDSPVLVDGVRARQAMLMDHGQQHKPTLVTVGTVSFFVHHFGDQYAIRIKDRLNTAIQAFPGCQWFAVKPAYRIAGKFVPHSVPQPVPIKTIVNTDSVYKSVGLIEFTWQGQPLRFLAQAYGLPHQVWIVFRDATAGEQTYGPGRFLTIDVDDDGQALLDFNKAYNPPCAVSPYATCPLPPRENILAVRIEAGERYIPTPAPAHAAPVLHEQIA